MKLIVGLGNPGRKYEQTRHNVGFDVLDLLAPRLASIGSGGASGLGGAYDAGGKVGGRAGKGLLGKLASGLRGADSQGLAGSGAGRAKFQGQVREGQLGGEKILLLAPQTFMNRSGLSVREAVDFYKLDLEELLVICDDFQLPLGQLRLRGRGSDGGQKGLADIAARLGEGYARLRIGIGPVPPGWDAADFVLGKFAASERDEADIALQRASDAAVAWASSGLAAAMNQYNRKKES